MTIRQNLVPVSKYNLKCPHTMDPVGICVHNTANDASAWGEISYMVTNTSQTSFHFAIDDIEAVQGLPLERAGWHAGDGEFGAGNRKHIGIEICYSKSGGDRFNKAEDNAAEMIAKLLKERKWGIERVQKHQDFSGKYCPHRTLDLGWERFLNKVRAKQGGNVDEKKYTEAEMTATRLERDSNWNLFKKEEKAHAQTKIDIKKVGQERYEQGVADGKKMAPTSPTIGAEWEANGVVVTEKVSDTVTKTTNYAKKN